MAVREHCSDHNPVQAGLRTAKFSRVDLMASSFWTLPSTRRNSHEWIMWGNLSMQLLFRLQSGSCDKATAHPDRFVLPVTDSDLENMMKYLTLTLGSAVQSSKQRPHVATDLSMLMHALLYRMHDHAFAANVGSRQQKHAAL